MTLTILKWLVIISATMNFGFMAFDGARALTVGDYIRPEKGEYAGQLGPWSKIVSAIGISPESTLMKVLFVLWGVLGLILTICFSLNIEWAWTGLLIISISALWYLIPGTALNVFQILLLLIIRYIRYTYFKTENTL